MKQNKSKELAFLLRHDTEYEFLEHGFREVSDLIENHGFTKELLGQIVKEDSKNRYEFSGDFTKIRARQGHSIPVDVELELISDPPKYLYHGTSSRFIDSIKRSGILKMSRLYVHLSAEPETAKTVGKRHGGQTIVLKIDSKRMSQDGLKFWISSNGVYLCDYVDPKYIIDEKICSE